MTRPAVNIAIDLETLSTSPAAVILSIGAVAIDQDTGVKHKFYSPCSRASQAGRKIDMSTLDWWSKQSAEARTALDQAEAPDCTSLFDALTALTNWIGALGEDHDVYVWGNGANFDVAILEHAYKERSDFVPWNFRKVRDMRTLYQITLLFGLDIKGTAPRVGVHHNALDDAEFQADVVDRSLHLMRALAHDYRVANENIEQLHNALNDAERAQ